MPNYKNDRYVNNSTVMRSFAGKNAFYDKNFVTIKKNGEIVASADLNTLCMLLEARADDACNTLHSVVDELKAKGIDLSKKTDEYSVRELFEIISENNRLYSEFYNVVYTYQKAKSIFKYTKSDRCNVMLNELHEQTQRLYDIFGPTAIKLLVSMAVSGAMVNKKNFIEPFFDEATNFSVDEAMELVERFIPKGRGDDYVIADFLENPTPFIKKLEKKGYITASKSEHFFPKKIKLYNKNLNYESIFLTTRACITAYLYGNMDLEHMRRNFDTTQLFSTFFLRKNQNVSLDDIEETAKSSIFFKDNVDEGLTIEEHGKRIVEIMKLVKPKETCSIGFWNYYTNGVLSREDMMEILSIGDYIDIEEVVHNFMNRHQIAEVLNENEPKPGDESYASVITKEEISGFDYIFDEEKTYQLLSPALLIKQYSHGEVSPEISKYIQDYLKPYYEKQDKDLNAEFMDEYIHLVQSANISKEESLNILKNLYENHLITAEQLAKSEISASDIETLVELECKNFTISQDDTESTQQNEQDLEQDELRQRSIDALVDFYNAGIIDQEFVIERYSDDGNEQLIAELIRAGMKADVFEGYKCCEELIRFVVANDISAECDLSCLSKEMDINKIMKLYQPSDDGNAHKQIEGTKEGLTFEGLFNLVECGLITLEQAEKIDQAYNYKMAIDALMDNGLIVGDKKGIYVEPGHGDGGSSQGTSIQGKVDETSKEVLYGALDREYVVFGITSSVLKKYNLVVLPNLKIAMMEPNENGEGATYVMGITLALDQIFKIKNGSKDKDPLRMYRNKTGIRHIEGMQIVNHGEGWGGRLVHKMEKIHPNMEELIYGNDSEEERKEHEEKIKWAKHRADSSYRQSKLDQLQGNTGKGQ